MKPYKPLLAQDSQRLIVIDENVKVRSFTHVVLKALSIVFLLFLTFTGVAWGLNLDPVQDKLNSIDLWASNPSNQLVLMFVCFGFLGALALMYVLYWAYKYTKG